MPISGVLLRFARNNADAVGFEGNDDADVDADNNDDDDDDDDDGGDPTPIDGDIILFVLDVGRGTG
jgi:stringent starvation protein B